MKVALSGFLLITLFFFSCDSNTFFPTESPDYLTHNPDDASLYKLTGFEQLITLPPKSALYKDSIFSVSQTINGEDGGNITLEKYYVSASGDSIAIHANLIIQKHSFVGTEMITMTVDSEYAALQFYPEMVFLKPLRLFQKFSGLNLQGIPTGTIDFVYVTDEGNIVPVEKGKVQVVKPQGVVRVMNAKLEHFSRYGWIR